MTSCVIRKSDFMKDNEFSQELLISHIASTLEDQPKWNDLISTSCKSCLKKGMDGHEKIINMFSKAPFSVNPKECNPLPMYVANCVDAEILVVSYFEQSEKKERFDPRKPFFTELP